MDEIVIHISNDLDEVWKKYLGKCDVATFVGCIESFKFMVLVNHSNDDDEE